MKADNLPRTDEARKNYLINARKIFNDIFIRIKEYGKVIQQRVNDQMKVNARESFINEMNITSFNENIENSYLMKRIAIILNRKKT